MAILLLAVGDGLGIWVGVGEAGRAVAVGEVVEVRVLVGGRDVGVGEAVEMKVGV
jgi:hypothetical protein